MKTILGMGMISALLAGVSATTCSQDGPCRQVGYSAKMEAKMEAKAAHFQAKMASIDAGEMRMQAVPTGPAKCTNGMAGNFFPCKGVDMLSSVPLTELGSAGTARSILGSDIWGWTDPETKREYALVTAMDGMTVVDVTDGTDPQPLFRIPTKTTPNSRTYWRDVKVYKNAAYVVADAMTGHGLQVFDLTQVRGAPRRLQVVDETFWYKDISKSHNIFVNEDTGFGYSIGGRDSCAGGIHLLDLSDPLRPKFAGCWSEDGYVHDIECVVYDGPDSAYTGREICFCYNEDTLTAIDITDKTVQNEVLTGVKVLWKTSYPGARYVHQGWLTEDSRFLLLGDEQDEENQAIRSKTHVYRIEDLDNPTYLGAYSSPEVAIDHNLYIKGNLAYMSNYASGLRVNDVSNIASNYNAGRPLLTEVAYFDTYPATTRTATFDGLWSSYVFLPSGNLLLGSQEYGLIVARLGQDDGGDDGGSTPTPAPTEPAACEDTGTPYGYSCSQIATAYYCSRYELIAQECRRSCGLCGSSRSPLAPSADTLPDGVDLDSQDSAFPSAAVAAAAGGASLAFVVVAALVVRRKRAAAASAQASAEAPAGDSKLAVAPEDML